MDEDLLRLQTSDSTAECLGLIPSLSTSLRAQGQGAERKKIKPKDQNPRPPSNFPDSVLNPLPSLISTELPERSFNNLIRSFHYLSFNPPMTFHDI